MLKSIFKKQCLNKRSLRDRAAGRPPLYEFFLVNGEKMSSRKGKAYTLHDLLKAIKPGAIKSLR